jgi:histone demethylase JARID1
VIRVVDEELRYRASIVKNVVNESSVMPLPANDFSAMDDKATDYDELRCCCICNHACIFTALACACDEKKVWCVRHYGSMCRCAKEQKMMLGKSVQLMFSLVASCRNSFFFSLDCR